MRDLSKLSPADAAHMLCVLEWLQKHEEDLRARAEASEQTQSLASVEAAFHQCYHELTCTRLVPVTISVFTDQDGLSFGQRREPNLLIRPWSSHTSSWLANNDLSAGLDMGHEPDATLHRMFEKIGDVLGVGIHEHAWRVEINPEDRLQQEG